MESLEDDGYVRFCKELEMVQSLAYPGYLHQLAKHGILEQPEFIAYLCYLQYWKQPDYAKFVVYPLALHMLELLQESTFRANMKNEQLVSQMGENLLRHWATWRSPSASAALGASTAAPAAPLPVTAR